MSLLLFAALASAAAALLLGLGIFVQRPRRCAVPLVVTLSLRAAMPEAIVATPKHFTITPKDAFGLPVDLAKFPTALTGVTWSVANPAIASVSPVEGSLGAEVTFSAEGTTTIVVKATNVEGKELSEQIDVTAKLPVPVIVALGLAEA